MIYRKIDTDHNTIMCTQKIKYRYDFMKSNYSKNDLPNIKPIKYINYTNNFIWYNYNLCHRDNDLPCVFTISNYKPLGYKPFNITFKKNSIDYRYYGYCLFKHLSRMFENKKFIRGICLSELKRSLDE